MNTARQVDSMIQEWKSAGMKKAEMTARTAEACLGWPYVYGEWGDYCTPAVRRKRANGIQERLPKEADVIRKGCPVLNGSSNVCDVCKWYPNDEKVRCFDCRGFTKWVLEQAGIEIEGQGATSQWKTESNWKEKGKISEMPTDQVCVVFMWDNANQCMSHTGLHIGGGVIVHCSGEVKYGRVSDRGWTHYAIPNGMEGEAPAPAPVPEARPTLRKGSSGKYVELLQNKLINAGYSLDPYGADGKFGARTETEVRAFQVDVGLTPDGVVGPMTWAALYRAEEANNAAKDMDPEPRYTLTIPHLTHDKAYELMSTYGGELKEEN